MSRSPQSSKSRRTPVQAQSPRAHKEEAVVPLSFRAMPRGQPHPALSPCVPQCSRQRPPTSAELNALAEARNERSDSGESELDAESLRWTRAVFAGQVSPTGTRLPVDPSAEDVHPHSGSHDDWQASVCVGSRARHLLTFLVALCVLSDSGHEVIRGPGQERSTSGFSTAFSLQRAIRRSRCTSSQWVRVGPGTKLPDARGFTELTVLVGPPELRA